MLIFRWVALSKMTCPSCRQEFIKSFIDSRLSKTNELREYFRLSPPNSPRRQPLPTSAFISASSTTNLALFPPNGFDPIRNPHDLYYFIEFLLLSPSNRLEQVFRSHINQFDSIRIIELGLLKTIMSRDYITVTLNPMQLSIGIEQSQIKLIFFQRNYQSKLSIVKIENQYRCMNSIDASFITRSFFIPANHRNAMLFLYLVITNESMTFEQLQQYLSQ